MNEIEKKLNYPNNFDVVKRIINEHITLYYLSSIVDNEIINDVIRGIYDSNDKIMAGGVKEVKEIDNVVTEILSGCLILVNNDTYYSIETRNYPTRGVSEPDSEKSIQGSHDGFTENIIINTALIRRRIKDENFRCELLSIGKESKTNISINYLQNKADNNLINQIKEKLKNVSINSLITGDKALTELIFNQKYHIFPVVRYTERPDIASIHLLKGYIVILVDTISSCIIIPTTFFEMNDQLQEYQLPPIIATVNRLFRLFCAFIGMYLLPFWFILCISGKQSNDTILLISDISQKRLFIEIISAIIFLNAIQLASSNTPTILSTSMSLVATIIFSSVSVEVGLIHGEVLFYTALSALCTHSISNYEISRAIRLCNFLQIIAIGLFSKVGYIILFTIINVSIMCINNFGVYYLYPLVPFDFNKLLTTLFKFSAKNKRTGKEK